MTTTTITVAGAAAYDVVVGRELMPAAVAAIPRAAARVAILCAPFLVERAEELADLIAATGRAPLIVELADAESAKTVQSAAQCWDLLGGAGFTRTDSVVGFGGGATTDLAGFVAATWLRGVPVIHIPTTLLGMVDAAVGGKTGINTTAGKNLVGAIHPPQAVVCDLDWLHTLPRADLAAGMAEVVKAGFIRDPAILDLVAADPDAVLDPATPVLADVAARAIRVKAAVVADDLTESVDRELGREILNYGHTLAHAIERVEGYRWRHGDAVSVGMCFAAALSTAAGRLSRAEAARHRALLESLGLPTRYPGGGFDRLVAAMRLDKKTRGATLRFIVLDAIGRPGLLAGPSEELLRTAFEEVS
jgi:3-dehydroquinate synthase